MTSLIPLPVTRHRRVEFQKRKSTNSGVGLVKPDTSVVEVRRIRLGELLATDLDRLTDLLRSQLGCWNHYRLRLWRECRSFNLSGIDDRIRIAEEILAGPYCGSVIWAWGGLVLLVAEVEKKLSDPDPHIRLEADFALRALRDVQRN